jgi:hypothetical protein
MKRGKTESTKAWVTDLEPTSENIEKFVMGARSRWKIENECFNTLKNSGYHIEHNYGHGKKHLSFNFFLLNLLAFFLHQIQRLADTLFTETRERCGPYYVLYENMRALARLMVWDSYEDMLEFIFKASERTKRTSSP